MFYSIVIFSGMSASGLETSQTHVMLRVWRVSRAGAVTAVVGRVPAVSWEEPLRKQKGKNRRRGTVLVHNNKQSLADIYISFC